MAYLKAAGHNEGPLFRAAGSGEPLLEWLAWETVARIFKSMAEAAAEAAAEKAVALRADGQEESKSYPSPNYFLRPRL